MARSVPPRRTAAPTAPPAVAAPVWEPCPFCWGRRRVLHRARNGGGPGAAALHGLPGVGERPSVPRPGTGRGTRRG
jgi:hypothetical protein